MLGNNTYKQNWNTLSEEKKENFKNLVNIFCNLNYDKKEEAYQQLKDLMNNDSNINIKDMNGYVFDRIIEIHSENKNILTDYITLIGRCNVQKETVWIGPDFYSNIPLYSNLIYTDCDVSLTGIMGYRPTEVLFNNISSLE